MRPRSREGGLESFLATIRPVQVRAPLVETAEHVEIRETAELLVGLETAGVHEIAEMLAAPRGLSRAMLRALGLAVGLSHERLTSELRAHLNDEERRRPLDVVHGEIEEMAAVRTPTQFVLAVVDGIGWHRRQADLGRIYALYSRRLIDGLYSLALLDDFRVDVDRAATLRGIERLEPLQ